jgi:transposase
VSRRSPFQVVLTADERRMLEARVRRRKAEQREVLRAQVVLAAAQGEENKQIAERLGIAPNTASKWRKRFFQEGLAGLADRDRPGRPRAFPLAVIAEVKAIAGELPALRAVPLSRFSIADVRQEAIACGLVEQLSVSTVWRWLDEDALKPWRHRSWIFPRARTSPPRRGSCSTCTSAGLRASGWGQTSS